MAEYLEYKKMVRDILTMSLGLNGLVEAVKPLIPDVQGGGSFRSVGLKVIAHLSRNFGALEKMQGEIKRNMDMVAPIYPSYYEEAARVMKAAAEAKAEADSETDEPISVEVQRESESGNE